MIHIITIKDEYVGISVKNFLKKKIDLSFHDINKNIDSKRITLNQKKIKQGDKLSKGDTIEIHSDKIKERKPKQNTIQARDLKIPIIYEDKELLVLNKPAGVVVQGAQDNDTSLSLHLQFLKEKNKDSSDFQYFHAHRIDKLTSGVLVCGKTRESIRELNKLFKEKKIKKEYLCLCYGHFNKKKGEISVPLKKTSEEVFEKVTTTSTEDKEGRPTLSLYHVLNEYKYKGEKFSLVEVEIKTVFTHQIRVHMKYLGHEIVGDKMYANQKINNLFIMLKRHFLHAKLLQFKYKNKKFTFDAPMTQDLKGILKLIKEERKSSKNTSFT